MYQNPLLLNLPVHKCQITLSRISLKSKKNLNNAQQYDKPRTSKSKTLQVLDPLGKLIPSWTKQLILPPFNKFENGINGGVEQVIGTLHRDDEAGI